MVGLLLQLIILALIAWVAFWIIDQVQLPSPFNWLAKGVVAVLALMALLDLT